MSVAPGSKPLLPRLLSLLPARTLPWAGKRPQLPSLLTLISTQFPPPLSTQRHRGAKHPSSGWPPCRAHSWSRARRRTATTSRVLRGRTTPCAWRPCLRRAEQVRGAQRPGGAAAGDAGSAPRHLGPQESGEAALTGLGCFFVDVVSWCSDLPSLPEMTWCSQSALKSGRAPGRSGRTEEDAGATVEPLQFCQV